MSPAPRPLRLPRLLMACALALALVLAPSACTPGRTDAVVTTISAQRAEEESATASADCTNALETGSGTVALLSLSSTASRDSTLVVSRDADDRIQWAVLIDRPTACIRALSDYPGKPQDGAESILDNTMGNNPVSYAVLSPDGARLSLILLPEAVGDVAQQRTEVVVLDTATGGLVRRAEVTGLVLGQALTDDALAVQTARAPFPGGAGQGLISVFPLGDPTAPGSSFPSGQWLAGAGHLPAPVTAEHVPGQPDSQRHPGDAHGRRRPGSRDRAHRGRQRASARSHRIRLRLPGRRRPAGHRAAVG